MMARRSEQLAAVAVRVLSIAAVDRRVGRCAFMPGPSLAWAAPAEDGLDCVALATFRARTSRACRRVARPPGSTFVARQSTVPPCRVGGAEWRASWGVPNLGRVDFGVARLGGNGRAARFFLSLHDQRSSLSRRALQSASFGRRLRRGFVPAFSPSARPLAVALDGVDRRFGGPGTNAETSKE